MFRSPIWTETEREGSERRELAFMLIVDDGAAAAAAASNFRANSWSVPSFSKKSTRRNFRYLFPDRPSLPGGRRALIPPSPFSDPTSSSSSSSFIPPISPSSLAHMFPSSPTLSLCRKEAVMDRIGLTASATQQSESVMRGVHDRCPPVSRGPLCSLPSDVTGCQVQSSLSFAYMLMSVMSRVLFEAHPLL